MATSAAARRTATDGIIAEPPKQVVLTFDEATYRRIQEELLPLEKRKLTGQLEYLLLQQRDKEVIIRLVDRFKKRAGEDRPIKVAVKISANEYWKGQEEAAMARVSFRDYGLALLEDWADQSNKQIDEAGGARTLVVTR